MTPINYKAAQQCKTLDTYYEPQLKKTFSSQMRDQAYLDSLLEGKFGQQCIKIMKLLWSIHPEGLTNMEISERLALPHSSVAGRMNELHTKFLVDHDGKRENKTGVNATVWKVVV